MPSRGEKYAEIAREVLEPHVKRPDTAWRGYYQLLLWFHGDVPHIIDADKLEGGAWRHRAEDVALALARELKCSISEVADKVDLLVRSDLFERPPQRNNVTGKGFVTALFLALRHLSSPTYEFLPEGAIGTAVFRGIRDAPRSRPDIVVVKNGREIAVISAKWSIRHDRLKDLKDECNWFKTLVTGLKYCVVTNEFDPARLNKVLEDYRIDDVFHVNRRLVVDVAKVDGRLESLRDLSDLLQLFTS